MSQPPRTEHSYTVRVHRESGYDLWAEVDELPGCFATGGTMDELTESLAEAIGLYLSTPANLVQVNVETYREVGSVAKLLVSS